MKRLTKAITIFGIAALFAGCSTQPVQYVDKSYSSASYSDIKQKDNPIKATLLVDFYRDGNLVPAASYELEEAAVRALRSTKVIEPVILRETANLGRPGPDETLNIKATNIPEKNAKAQGFGTGMTFGMVGSDVSDFYTFEVEWVPAEGDPITTEYKHRIVTTIGNTSPPQSAEQSNTAFADVVEDVIYNFLRDAQQRGILK